MRGIYYGRYVELISNYEFKTFEIDGQILMLQASGIFGVKMPHLHINNPACILMRDGVYYRFVLDGLSYQTDKDGQLRMSDSLLQEIINVIGSI